MEKERVKFEASAQTLLAWANFHLAKGGGQQIQTLAQLGDGHTLARLIQAIAQKELPNPVAAPTASSKLQNIIKLYSILSFLISEGLQIPQSCSPQVLADGDQAQLLGLLKRLAWHYLIVDSNEDYSKTPHRYADGGILVWANRELQRSNYPVKQKTLYDGSVILALIHLVCPGLSIPKSASEYSSLGKQEKIDILQKAFNEAENQFAIPQLLKASDILALVVDHTSILIYLALLRLTMRLDDKKNPHKSSEELTMTEGFHNLNSPAAEGDSCSEKLHGTKLGKQINLNDLIEDKKEESEEQIEADLSQGKKDVHSLQPIEILEERSVKDEDRQKNSQLRNEEDGEMDAQLLKVSENDRELGAVNEKGGEQGNIDQQNIVLTEETKAVEEGISYDRESLEQELLTMRKQIESKDQLLKEIQDEMQEAKRQAQLQMDRLKEEIRIMKEREKTQPVYHSSQVIAAAGNPAREHADKSVPFHGSPPSPAPIRPRRPNRSITISSGTNPRKIIVNLPSSSDSLRSSKTSIHSSSALPPSSLSSSASHSVISSSYESPLSYSGFMPLSSSLSYTRPRTASTSSLPSAFPVMIKKSSSSSSLPIPTSPGGTHSVQRICKNLPLPTLELQLDRIAKKRLSGDKKAESEHDSENQQTEPVDIQESPETAKVQAANSAKNLVNVTAEEEICNNEGLSEGEDEEEIIGEDTESKTPASSPPIKREASNTLRKNVLEEFIGHFEREMELLQKEKELRGESFEDEKESALIELEMVRELSRHKRNGRPLLEGVIPILPGTTDSTEVSDEKTESDAVLDSILNQLSSDTSLPSGIKIDFSQQRWSQLLSDAIINSQKSDTASLKKKDPNGAGDPEENQQKSLEPASSGTKKRKEKREKKSTKQKDKERKGTKEPKEAINSTTDVKEKGEKKEKSGFSSLRETTKKRMSLNFRTSSFSSRILAKGTKEEDTKDLSNSSPKIKPKQSSLRNLRSLFGNSLSSLPNDKNKKEKKAKDGPDTSEEGIKGTMVALYDFHGRKEDEISFLKGDVIYLVSDLDETGWALGKVKANKPHQDEKIGLFPVEFVRHVDESKKENRSEASNEDEDDIPPLPSESKTPRRVTPVPRIRSITISEGFDPSPLATSPTKVPPSLLTGWLSFKHSAKKWQLYYFVLHQDVLCYFKSEKGDKKPVGRISLAEARLEASESLDSKQKKEHCLLITTKAGKSFHLSANNQKELHRWIDALKTTIASTNYNK